MRRFQRIRARRRGPRSWRRWLADLALSAVVLAALFLVVARIGGAGQVTLEGHPVVIDGDTLVLAGVRVRLEGIDAPELRQQCRRGAALWPCGHRAREALVSVIGGGAVRCDGWERDRYGRLLAACMVSATGINARLVETGWAVAYGRYVAEERRARNARAGIWVGSFDRPQDWRAVNGGVVEMPPGNVRSLVNWLRQLALGWVEIQ